jgi:hypothetical protein
MSSRSTAGPLPQFPHNPAAAECKNHGQRRASVRLSRRSVRDIRARLPRSTAADGRAIMPHVQIPIECAGDEARHPQVGP